MGKALFTDGQIEQALERTQKALELARQRGEQGHLAYALNLLGEIAMQPYFLNRQLAENHLCDAIKIAEALTMRPLLVDSYKKLSQFYLARGNSHKADEFSKKSEQMKHVIAALNKVN